MQAKGTRVGATAVSVCIYQGSSGLVLVIHMKPRVRLKVLRLASSGSFDFETECSSLQQRCGFVETMSTVATDDRRLGCEQYLISSVVGA